MSLTAAAMRLLADRGLTLDEIIAVAAANGNGGAISDPVSERRRAYDRERKRSKANSGGIPVENPDEQNGVIPVETPVEFHRKPDIPRAHVRDNNPTKVLTGKAVVVVSADARETDDWPEADPSKALIAEVASPWLDPMKTPGLVLTAARVSAWRREGASWRDDVIPVVTTACQRRKSAIQSWQFFDAAIAQSIANNRAGLTIPEARAGPMNLSDQIIAERAEAHRLAFARMDAEDARNAARQQT